MDIFTHMTMGAASTHLALHKSLGKKAFVIGAIAGVFADIDSFWYWPTTPIFNLLVHRSLTHSLLFVPFFAAFVAWILGKFFKKKGQEQSFRLLFLASFISYLTHIFLDYTNSYGTYLFWPLSFERYYLDLFPIIDWLLSLPLFIFLFWAYKRNDWRIHLASLAWFFSYLFLAFLQHEQVLKEQEKLILKRGQEAVKVRAIPTINNIFSWRSLYRTPTHVYADKVVCFPLLLPKVEEGDSLVIARKEAMLTTYLNAELIDKNFSYFEKFTDGFVGFLPSEKADTQVLGDLRYSRNLKGFDSRVRVEFDRNQALKAVKLIRYH
mgnify:CR=1 FL=1